MFTTKPMGEQQMTSHAKAIKTRRKNEILKKIDRGVKWILAFIVVSGFTVGSVWAFSTELGDLVEEGSEPVSQSVVRPSDESVNGPSGAIVATATPDLTIEEYVFKEVEKELGTEEAIKAVILIGGCENKAWNPDIITKEPNSTYSLGLWQINTIHKDISNADKLNHKKAIAWSIEKRKKDTNWSAWTCGR